MKNQNFNEDSTVKWKYFRGDYSLQESCFVLAFIVVSELDVTLDPGQLYGLLLSDGVGPIHNGVPGL